MASRDYQRLTIEAFGRQLLTTGDLDPIYISLWQCQERKLLTPEQVCRWLVAYWCYYDAGVASWMSERTGAAFWEAMLVAARNEAPTPLGGRWSRGKERRHFRGLQGIQATQELAKRYPQPEAMVHYIANEGAPATFVQVAGRAQEHRGFGPWISFKIADMLNRILMVPVDFDKASVFMFDDPRKSALMVFRDKQKMPKDAPIADEAAAIDKVLGYLGKVFKDYKAAPDYVRPLNVQELETILCKFKSHLNGHYGLNNDIHEILEGVKPWIQHSSTAAKFISTMPNGNPIL